MKYNKVLVCLDVELADNIKKCSNDIYKCLIEMEDSYGKDLFSTKTYPVSMNHPLMPNLAFMIKELKSIIGVMEKGY